MHPDIKAAVHLESGEDELFWDTMLQRNHPGKYYYIYSSKSNSGIETSGCEQCLKYRQYLSPNFFICIDSDLRYLLGEENLDAQHYICQTYTYSWENHFCHSEHIREKMAEKDIEGFDFNKFLSDFSSAIYVPLLLLLYCQRTGKAILTHKQFRAGIPSQMNAQGLSSDGSSYITAMKQYYHPFIEQVKASGWDVEAEKEIYCQKHLTLDNAYLHIRGHELFNLLQYVGTRTCSNAQISFTNDILLTDLKSNGYWEIDSVNEDINELLGIEGAFQ